MRITGGVARGRQLTAPKATNLLLRPTCDRVRQALFNILGERVQGRVALDFFAGTGAWGIECLSRGARFALFVDHSPEAGRLIEKNLGACFARPQAAFLRIDLASACNLHLLASKAPAPFDLLFIDPPYQKNLAQPLLTVVEGADILGSNPLVVVEEHRSISLPTEIGSLALADQRRYGETGLWIYERRSPPT